MKIFGIRSTSFVDWFAELVSGRRLEAERYLFNLRKDDTAALVDWSRPLDILDLGSGRMRPQLELLTLAGHNVTGVDLTNGESFSMKRLAYTAARRIFNKQAQAGLPHDVKKGTATLVSCDAQAMPFPDETYDLVTSIAAFEHFADPGKVLQELHRILRPGGSAWLWIHNFTALSGAHNVGNTFPPLKKIPPHVAPWDHLREKREPITVPLNKWRASRYHEELHKLFEVPKSYFPLTEGEQFWSPSIAEELSEYSKEELLGAAFVLVATKRN